MDLTLIEGSRPVTTSVASKALGVTPRTLFRYRRIGMLRSKPNPDGGHSTVWLVGPLRKLAALLKRRNGGVA